MKKLIAVLTAVVLSAVLLIPASGFAAEEIQLAAAIGSADPQPQPQPQEVPAPKRRMSGSESNALDYAVVSAVVIGAAVANVINAAKNSDSTSNH